MKPRFIAFALLCLISINAARGGAQNLRSLAREFFQWRAVTQPATYDDVNRVERPDGWIPDWSPDALARIDAKRDDFLKRLNSLSHSGWTVSDSVDFLLLRSAFTRVALELNVIRSARRNPDFYVQQTLGVVYELVLQPPPFTDTRTRNIVLRLESIPTTLNHARGNLTEAVEAFAGIAVGSLAKIESHLERFAESLQPLLPADHRKRFNAAVNAARKSLVAYREWLKEKRSTMQGTFVIGREAYERLLKEIALMPYSSDEILQMGRIEWERSVAFDHYETLRNAGVSATTLFPNSTAQIDANRTEERNVRTFLVEKDILDVPDWMGHYENRKMPGYIAALKWLGVPDDFTSPSRLGENSTKYIPEPSSDLPFFSRATAEDTRPILVHEGVPGHFFQLSLSWANPDSIRRHYFDSGPVEGIGFYAEEMMLQHGYFDDRPRTREIIYRFMRLRALRVEVDVRLARGDFSIEDAAHYLARTVPMDEETARQEAAFFASNPGQAISYQIGKIQIVRFIADAKIQQKAEFNLRKLHNFIWQNGNVPIALQRWEYLGLRDEIPLIW